MPPNPNQDSASTGYDIASRMELSFLNQSAEQSQQQPNLPASLRQPQKNHQIKMENRENPLQNLNSSRHPFEDLTDFPSPPRPIELPTPVSAKRSPDDSDCSVGFDRSPAYSLSSDQSAKRQRLESGSFDFEHGIDPKMFNMKGHFINKSR